MLNTDLTLFFDLENKAGTPVNSATLCQRMGGAANLAPGSVPAGGCPVIGLNSVSKTAPLLTVNKKAIAGGAMDKAKSGGGNYVLKDTRELIMEYADATVVSSSTVFNGASTVGQDSWFPDFMDAYSRLGSLGNPNLQNPCEPAACTPVTNYLGTDTGTTAAPTVSLYAFLL